MKKRHLTKFNNTHDESPEEIIIETEYLNQI
jgi:hypothetical protein